MVEPLKLSVSVRSSSLAVGAISALIGYEPTRSPEKGTPRSLRNPDGSKHGDTIWRFEASTETERDLWSLADELKPILTRLGELERSFDSVRVWLMAYCRPMGAWVTFDSEFISLMGQAGAELNLDLYCGDECCSDDESQHAPAVELADSLPTNSG